MTMILFGIHCTALHIHVIIENLIERVLEHGITWQKVL